MMQCDIDLGMKMSIKKNAGEDEREGGEGEGER